MGYPNESPKGFLYFVVRRIYDFFSRKRIVYVSMYFFRSLRNRKMKIKSFTLKSVKDYSDENDLQYKILEGRQLRDVCIPRYFGDKDKPEIIKAMSPEIYIAELLDVTVLGANGHILAKNNCLYDMATYNNKFFDLRFESLIDITNNKALVFINPEVAGTFEIAIYLIGFATHNYYHVSLEVISRLQYVDSFEEYRSLPLLVDEVVLNTPQYKELLNAANKFNHPIIPLKRNQQYNVKKLIFPSHNTWMPINVKNRGDFKSEFSLIASSAVDYLRSLALQTKEEVTGYRKLFISRKNMRGTRLINESETVELFRSYGFEIIYPEKMSFKEQVETFKYAKYIAGSSGAAFTNILYCPKNATIINIIPKEYNFCIYSTISHLLGIDCVFLDASVYKTRKNISAEFFSLDVDYCEGFLKSLEN